MSDTFVPPPESFDDDRGPGFRAYIIVLTVLSTIATGLRFWSRWLSAPTSRNLGRFWWDDWTALAAVLVLYVQLGVSLALLDAGLGRHVWAIQPSSNLVKGLQLLFIEYFAYDLTLVLAKASALFFLTRVFHSHDKKGWFYKAIIVTHVLNILWFIGIVVGTLLRCDPLRLNWALVIDEGHCGDASALYIGSAVPSVFIDLIILLLPIPSVWKLHTTLAKKIGISIIFVFGYGVIVVSLGRLVTVLTREDEINFDVTYAGVDAFYWNWAESPITILGISLPAMLRLKTMINSKYYQNLLSKVSTIFTISSTRNTTNGHSWNRSKSSAKEYPRNPNSLHIQLNSVNDSQHFQETGQSDLVKRFSNESQENMYTPPASHDSTRIAGNGNYSARVAGNRGGAQSSMEMPQSEIHVNNEVFVSYRQEHQDR